MLASAVLILLAGFFAGQLARRFGAPPLIGMILIGILIGPQFADLIGVQMLNAADPLRVFAVMIILVKAGLGLEREKLRQQGTVAIRLGILPALSEALVIAAVAMALFDFDFLTGLLLGFLLGAESPAVIVPGMLRPPDSCRLCMGVRGGTMSVRRRGVAQLAECCVWDAEVIGSNPVTPTVCGYGVMVAYDPSKVSVRVRVPLPAFARNFQSAAIPIPLSSSKNAISKSG